MTFLVEIHVENCARRTVLAERKLAEGCTVSCILASLQL